MSMADGKITASRLARDAYLYVRQSTLRQVAEHGESTQRQYALRNRAVALGWPAERIHVIDSDLGKSGADAAGRDGFQKLVSEVALGKVGIILGLEVSRLARNSADWRRLIELCSLTDALILDEDGVYDPTCFNDRLLLGLKGTMSEAELHVLKARMRGGQLNKAQSALEADGLTGLLPNARGPRDGHKLSAEVVAFVEEMRDADPKATTQQRLEAIERRFGVKAHRRSLERALSRKKKRIEQD